MGKRSLRQRHRAPWHVRTDYYVTVRAESGPKRGVPVVYRLLASSPTEAKRIARREFKKDERYRGRVMYQSVEIDHPTLKLSSQRKAELRRRGIRKA